MKVVYVLKKGFQYFPPCLTQVLYLNDLGVDLEIYHGKNTEAIDNILDERGIIHHTFSLDKQSKNRIESGMNFLKFIPEIRKLNNIIDKKTLIWFGNCETAIAFGHKNLRERRFILTTLELDSEKSFNGQQLKKFANYAERIVCCEAHRAAIMKSRYELKYMPYVVANKPYETEESVFETVDLKQKLSKYTNNFIVVYQGIITPDRPLEKIANALKKLDDPDIYFFVLGKCSDTYAERLKKIYNRTVLWGYIPAPEHLNITQRCNIGIANYDMSNLNNVFCAPNKIYEYSKYGLPMLTSLNVGLTETVGAAKAAECVNFDDEEEILKGIKTIKTNYRVYSENALKFYNDYDVKEKIAEVLSGLKENEK